MRLHLLVMNRLRTTTVGIVLLSLITFQVQALAQVFLPCQHTTATKAADCPMHGVALQGDSGSRDATDRDDRQLLECVKCMLVLTLGSLQVGPAPDSIRATRSVGDPPIPRPDHFYRFFPEPPAHPPQDHLA
jgi:hypothetical protein